MDNNVGIILSFDFCTTSDKYLLPSSGIFWHLLAFSGEFSHVIWFTEFCTRFAVFMNLPYADATSSSVRNLIFQTYMDPKDIFSDIL